MNAVFHPARSGVYRAAAGEAALRADAAAAGVAWIDLDLTGVHDKAALLQRIARVFGFPPYFGANWDALADALQDVPADAMGRVVWISGAADASRDLGAEWAVLVEILEETAIYARERERIFVAFADAPALGEWS